MDISRKKNLVQFGALPVEKKPIFSKKYSSIALFSLSSKLRPFDPFFIRILQFSVEFLRNFRIIILFLGSIIAHVCSFWHNEQKKWFYAIFWTILFMTCSMVKATILNLNFSNFFFVKLAIVYYQVGLLTRVKLAACMFSTSERNLKKVWISKNYSISYYFASKYRQNVTAAHIHHTLCFYITSSKFCFAQQNFSADLKRK